MANRRIEVFVYRQILVDMRLGRTDRQIARAKLLGRRKAAEVRAVAKDRGWLNPDNPLPDDLELGEAFKGNRPPPKPTSVLPFAADVDKWHGQGIDATVIHRTLQRKFGFEGSYWAVVRYVQKLRQAHPTATTILDFDPADAAQVDFGAGPPLPDPWTGKPRPTWIFVMTLAWSRHQYAEIVWNQKVGTWLACHRRAFEFFGGVPKRVIIDNLKAAVTKACYHDPEVHRAYAALAEGYGFQIAPCPPHDPQKKGIVESGVKYVKRAFVPLREFRHIEDANQQLMSWIVTEAGTRIHGTVFERPLERFAETERHLLKALPDIRPELAEWARVKLHGNCHVQYEKCRYSAPWNLVNQELWLRATESTVQIFHNHQMVAVHPRLFHHGDRATVKDHMPPEAVAWAMRDPQWCLIQAESIGPSCHAVIQRLFSDRIVDHLNAAQGIVGLAKRFGIKRVESACHRAMAYDAVTYRSIKRILEHGLDLVVVEQPETEISTIYGGRGRFCRDAKTMLTN